MNGRQDAVEVDASEHLTKGALQAIPSNAKRSLSTCTLACTCCVISELVTKCTRLHILTVSLYSSLTLSFAIILFIEDIIVVIDHVLPCLLRNGGEDKQYSRSSDHGEYYQHFPSHLHS